MKKLFLENVLKRLDRRHKRLMFLCADLALVPLAYLFTLAVQPGGPPLWTALSQAWLLLVLLVALTAGISSALGIPKIRLNSYDTQGMLRVGAMSLLVGLANAALHRIGQPDLPSGALVVFGIVFFLFAAASRVLMLETVLAAYRSQGKRCRVLIYGAGNTGMQLARALTRHDAIEAVAFVDDNTALQSLTIAGLPVLRPMDIERIVDRRRVDRVLLAMPSVSQPKLLQIARRLERIGLEVQALPSFAQLIGQEALLDKLVPVAPAQIIGRKTFDRSGALGCTHIEGRSVLVSGGGGSIGSELCRQVLTCKPRRLVIMEISELALYEAEKALRPLADETGTELVVVLGSVTEARLVRRTLSVHDVNVVLHAAAYKHVPIVEANPLVGLANNVLGTSTLATAARDLGIERFILISSDKAVRPTNVMGASKRLAELVVQDLAARSPDTIFAMVRFGNVVGSSGSVVPLFEEQIEQGGPVTVTHSEVTRYFMTIEEAVSLVLVAGSYASGGEVFVLDMGKPMRIMDIAKQIIVDSGYTVKSAANPGGDIEIKEIGLRPGEKLHEELLIGEGHLTTAHEKIFAAREAHLSEIEVASAIRSLREAMATGNDAAALAVVTRWVEGYVPDAERRKAAP
ncbi:polysaccharide biosynthesis protein [Profundibacterium mesophilum]|uniref:Nucleotide sugar epimerasedehydratase n=1 Tax=Profundibacterium mesophilum KAUST100406-0324 TaxID=1037889 RepID=A0A921TE40_9RHOB|nr:nucleoside-diphosphate sugar epimerase/dehydratase [Profundibacterium mesophilum]KAF0676966.1 Nucleotide sugar epimerasedehydratase [Profundibacterium mesophilum KAUST100406-0324]